MHTDYLTVKTYDNIKKIRVGSQFDGGYVIINDIGSYDCIISCGIGNNVEFENQLSKLYPDLPVYCFDGTINYFPQHSINNLTFVNKNVGINNSNKTTNLFDLLERYDQIFMKMDIEGAEFDYFHAFPEKYFSKIKQLVLEIHDIVEYSNMSSQSAWQVRGKLSRYYHIFHAHANNCISKVQIIEWNINSTCYGIDLCLQKQ